MKYNEIKLKKATVFLTNDEIQQLLRKDPALYKESLKRGKYILRNRKQTVREYQKYYEENNSKRGF